MTGEPTKPRPGEISSAATTGKAGSLPDTKSSTAEDIAATANLAGEFFLQAGAG